MLSYKGFLNYCKRNNKDTYFLDGVYNSNDSDEAEEGLIKFNKFVRCNNYSGKIVVERVTRKECTPYEAVTILIDEIDFFYIYRTLEIEDQIGYIKFFPVTYKTIIDHFLCNGSDWIAEYEGYENF